VPRMRCTSVPQIALVVIRTIASVGSLMRGSGTSPNRISPTQCHVTAFTAAPPEVCWTATPRTGRHASAARRTSDGSSRSTMGKPAPASPTRCARHGRWSAEGLREGAGGRGDGRAQVPAAGEVPGWPGTVPEVPLDLADDRGDRVTGEVDAVAGIELVDGLDQSDSRDLHQVVDQFAAACVGPFCVVAGPPSPRCGSATADHPKSLLGRYPAGRMIVMCGDVCSPMRVGGIRVIAAHTSAGHSSPFRLGSSASVEKVPKAPSV
jgi:hypothetical protein